MTNTIGSDFIEKSKYQYLDDSAEQEGVIPQPPLELPYPEGVESLQLPAWEQITVQPIDLKDVVTKRSSLRNYTEKSLSLAELSYLLWGTQGIKRVTKRPVTLRTVPSAGARHAFETYVLVNRVEGLVRGVYRYLAGKHGVVDLKLPEDCSEQITQACGGQGQINASAATFIWVAVTDRMTWRYGQRGYRYLHLDAGHVCQNLYLLAEQIGCGVCAIAAYDDDTLNAILRLDGKDLWVIYLASLGKRV
jgi:SagB-type dehydrogenase family enzyme